MTMPVHLRMRVPGLLMSVVAVPVAMLLPLGLRVLGLLVGPLVMRLTMLVPLRMGGPGP